MVTATLSESDYTLRFDDNNTSIITLALRQEHSLQSSSTSALHTLRPSPNANGLVLITILTLLLMSA